MAVTGAYICLGFVELKKGNVIVSGCRRAHENNLGGLSIDTNFVPAEVPRFRGTILEHFRDSMGIDKKHPLPQTNSL
jgi:hypothetical protein